MHTQIVAESSNLHTQYIAVINLQLRLLPFDVLNELASKVSHTVQDNVGVYVTKLIINPIALTLWSTCSTYEHCLTCSFTYNCIYSIIMCFTSLVVAKAIKSKKYTCIVHSYKYILTRQSAQTGYVRLLGTQNSIPPNCLMQRRRWNWGVSMIFTKSGCSRIEPWIGSLKTFCISKLSVSSIEFKYILTYSSFFAGGGSTDGWAD